MDSTDRALLKIAFTVILGISWFIFTLVFIAGDLTWGAWRYLAIAIPLSILWFKTVYPSFQKES